ncbi:DUF6177 family protein [Streptomyces sp. NPDC102406]|uniref:DUF6177 family protein n=1 Tax=Streptomyces sp. NPDC102406 TaxID=3366171 RepID=UPI003825B2DD
MTQDFIALTPKMPDTAALVAALHAGGPELHLSTTHDDAVIQLTTASGRPLVSVEAPVLIHTPGEAQRLLGPQPTPPPLPYWWTEIRASTAVPEAEPLAASVCGRLILLLGGTTWPRDTTSTAVVEPAQDQEDVTATPAPRGALPAIDVLTDSTAIVLADRPVLSLSTWLSDVLRTVSAADRALQIVTPPHVRLTLPLRAALHGAPNRWVVQSPEGGYYDGLSGAELIWQHGTFTPTGNGQVADAFTAGATTTDEHQLTITFRTVRPATTDLLLGNALETAWRHLTGEPPSGWGTAEPANLPWSPRQLTDLARDRAPDPTHTIAVGTPDHPAIATHRTTRTTAGVAEDVTLTIGYTAEQSAPLDRIEALAAELVAAHGLTTMLSTLATAPHDLTLAPHLTAPPIPITFTLGAHDVRAIGLTQARRPPLALKPVQLGPAAAPALHYPLGDGADPAAWTTLQRLTTHLRAHSDATG